MRIIYFDIDCLRPDHLGCYGYPRPTSPAIDAVASEGIRFNHYYCSSSPCLPSRTVLSSGRIGIRNGVVSNHGAGARFNIDTRAYGGPMPENQMFMRRLREAGFDTICFSNFADRHYAMWFMCGWSEYHTPNLLIGNETAEQVNAALLPWLEQNASNDNYYLHINYWDAHRIYKMDPSWARKFEDFPVPQTWPDEEAIRTHQSITGPFTAGGQFRNNESTVALMPGAVRNRGDFEHMVTGYDAAISYVDHHIRQVIDIFEDRGLLDDTAIIISGDHGDAFGEHGIYSDHVCVDECIHRVPLIIRWPGVTAQNVQSDSLLYNVDYPATICDLLGAETPSEWDGMSFAPNLSGNDSVDREYLVWDSGLYTVQRAVRTRDHLYIRTYDRWRYDNWQDEELHDMHRDPYETSNIAAENPEALNRARAALETWYAEQREKPNWAGDPLAAVLEERGMNGESVVP